MTTSFEHTKICVILPAHNEGELIGGVIRSLPEWVSAIVVVDDVSSDDTCAVVEALGDPRVTLVRHTENTGVGGAMASGYRAALELDCDILVKMDADGQMAPSDLPRLVRPLVNGRGRVHQGKPLLRRQREPLDAKDPQVRQRHPHLHDEDVERLLARVRFAVRLHGDAGSPAEDGRSRCDREGLLLRERHAHLAQHRRCARRGRADQDAVRRRGVRRPHRQGDVVVPAATRARLVLPGGPQVPAHGLRRNRGTRDLRHRADGLRRGLRRRTTGSFECDRRRRRRPAR